MDDSQNATFCTTILYFYPERRERHLEFKFYDENQVEDKMMWGLG